MKRNPLEYSPIAIAVKFVLSAGTAGVLYYLVLTFALFMGFDIDFVTNRLVLHSFWIVPLAAGIAGVFWFDQVLELLDKVLRWTFGHD
jgi:hypothetical protein